MTLNTNGEARRRATLPVAKLIKSFQRKLTSPTDRVLFNLINQWKTLFDDRSIAEGLIPHQIKTQRDQNSVVLVLKCAQGQSAFLSQYYTDHILNTLNAFFGETSITKIKIVNTVDFKTKVSTQKAPSSTVVLPTSLELQINENGSDDLQKALTRLGKEIYKAKD